jgi:hypothetical protein
LATAANAARIDACIVQRQTSLDSHFVLPGVAEVVFVPESFVYAKHRAFNRADPPQAHDSPKPPGLKSVR